MIEYGSSNLGLQLNPMAIGMCVLDSDVFLEATRHQTPSSLEVTISYFCTEEDPK